MDLYRLRYPPYPGCVSVELVEDLIKCSEPQEGTKTPLLESPIGVIEGRLDTMFFSQQQIHDTFGTRTMAGRILRCGCKGCDDPNRQSVNDPTYVGTITTKEGSLLVAVLVYLGKMHLLYPLIDWGATDTSKVRPLDIMEKNGDSWFRDGQKEREIFSGAWKRALTMFYPLKFDVKSHSDSARPSVRPFYKYEDSDRFPYWDCNYEFEPGAFGRMQKFQVPSEYLEPGAMAILDSYPGSTEGTGRTKKYLLVRKMITSVQAGGTDDENSMESIMLRILTTVKTAAKENIITLIAAYQWRNNIHYVFPFVRLDLNQVLRGHKVPKQLKTNRLEKSLRNHWLWEQAVLLCEALSTINTKLNDPAVATPLDQKGIIAFHFDLKPANILVTEDGVLKITDFGQSHIRPLREGEEMDGEWTGGDLVYQAPESKPSQAALRKARDSYITSGRWDEVRVPLNYDVWSLGCIMVEIMTFILDPTPKLPSSGLQKLDFDRRGETPSVGFFKTSDDNEAVLKDCVKDKLAVLKHEHQSSLAKGHYNAQVVGVTEQMLCVDPINRLSSSQVVDQLGIADEDYQRLKPEDELYQFMKSDEVENMKPDDNYGEVGWLDSGLIMSYLDLNDVEVEIMDLKNQSIKVHRRPCRMQVFLNRESEVASTVVRKRADSQDLPDFIICLAVENSDGKLSLHRGEMRVKSSAFVPLYLYETDGYECAIIIDSGGKYPTWKMTFSFNSISDACGFQRTFLLHRCSQANPDEDDPFSCRNTFVSVEFTQPKTGDLHPMKSDIVLQSWAKVKPLWVNASSRRGSSHASISTHSTGDSYSTTCGVIFTKKDFVVIPMLKKDKQYKRDIRKRNVLLVSPNTNFRTFNILKGAPCRLAGSAGLQNAPCILLEPSQFEISNLYRSPLERSISKMALEKSSATDMLKAISDLESLGWVSPKS